MLLNLLVLLLVFLVGAYLGNQGVLSALLGLIAATFGAILAGGLFEPLQGLIGGYRPEYARGFTFIILFVLGFAIARFAADFAVPENVKLPQMVNRILGGVFGLLAALVIVGSLLIGTQMLPLGTSIMGYDRFGGENGMQGDGPAAVSAGSNIWLAPDRVALACINLASGKSMGGDHTFTSIHPDLLTESYGYRNTVQPGATTALPPELLKVDLAWVSTEANVLSAFQIEQGKAAAVVRTQITSATEPPKNSVNAASSGSFFFVTPSEVRLVTTQGRQYYPIGYLEKGRTFTPTPLDSGQLAEDFAQGKSTVAEDWVFAIGTDEKPQFIEVKQLARVPLTGVLDKPAMPLASSEYPPRAYRQDQGSIDITASGFDSERLDSFKVYVVSKFTTIKYVKSIYEGPYKNIVDALQQINGTSGAWYTATMPPGTKGVPNAGDLNTAYRVLQDYMNKPPEEHLSWDNFLSYVFIGKSTTDGTHNLIELPKYFDETIVPYFTPAVMLKQGAVTDNKLSLTELPKGDLNLIAAAKTDKGFYLWVLNETIKPKTATNVSLTPANAQFKAVIK